MKDSNVLISTVGKRLVHYKHFTPGSKRAKVSLVSIQVLMNYLQTNEAVLVKKGNPKPSAAAA